MSASADTDRIFLSVPPEEVAQARALGACWDGTTKRWYLSSDAPAAMLSHWISPSEEKDDEQFTILSDEAYVAKTTVACQGCEAMMEVICIHCTSGIVRDDPIPGFTVSDISEVDEPLARQLKAWPSFRPGDPQLDEPAGYANYCPHCGSRQDDMFLHSEPDQPFFHIPDAHGSIELMPLTGVIRLTGDEHFSLD
jgi:hypothetical protein